jgi:acyl carrier protein
LIEKGVAMLSKVRDIVAKHSQLQVDVHGLHEDADLYAVGLTSFATVQLMLALEDAFDIEFSEKMLNRRTFQTLANMAGAVSDMQG